ncbi:MAG: class I adenylate-forming enzyme family protein [Acidimicrobiia bacterium]
MANLVERIAAHPGGATAVVAADATVTYGQLIDRAAERQRSMDEQGIRRGDRVAIVAAPTADFVATYLAVLASGATAVPLNPGSPAAELDRQLAVVEPALVLESGESVDPGEAPSGGGGSSSLRIAPVDPTDAAVLMFTSGTAGPPLAATLTHANLVANIDQLGQLPGWQLQASDVVYGGLPLFHVFGLNAVLGLALVNGVAVVLDPRFHAGPSLALLAEHAVTVVAAVPSMWQSWLVESAAGTETRGAWERVRIAVSGAAPLPEAVAVEVRRRFGVRLDQGYGLTETAPVVTTSIGRPAKPGSIGRPLPGVEIRLVDADGADAFVGDEGEILVRGPNVFAGYWHDEGATAAVFTTDGWLRTGDMAVADDDGDLFLVGRLKELVIVSGFNVYPAEVEAVLASHPGVEDVAVIGIADDHTGEAVKALVVPVAGVELDIDDLRAFAGARLARYKCPASVVLVPELPRGATGKVVRRALR